LGILATARDVNRHYDGRNRIAINADWNVSPIYSTASLVLALAGAFGYIIHEQSSFRCTYCCAGHCEKKGWQVSLGAQLPSPGSGNDYGEVFELTKFPRSFGKSLPSKL